MNHSKAIEGLKLFNEKAERLPQLSFTQFVNSQGMSLNISFGQGSPVVTQSNLPNQEAIEAFILTWRFFIQNNEQSSIQNLAKTYESLPIDDTLKSKFKELREKFNVLLDCPSQISLGSGLIISIGELQKIILYGGLAHAKNPELREQFLTLTALEPSKAWAFMAFYQFLRQAMLIIWDIAECNRSALLELGGNGK